MSVIKIVAFTLVAALFACGAAGEAEESSLLQRLLTRSEKAGDMAGGQEPAPKAHPARMQRRPHLSEDEREIMTKQIMQAISELMNSGCMSDRDYQGWVDFGRRGVE